MTPSSERCVRLAAADGTLLEDRHTQERGVITLTIEEIQRGRVRFTAENDRDRAVDERLYTVVGEEALFTAMRSVLHPGERPKTLRLHLEPLSTSWKDGPVEAIASAARLGHRASIATVEIRAGQSVIGRGALVSVVARLTAASHSVVALTAV